MSRLLSICASLVAIIACVTLPGCGGDLGEPSGLLSATVTATVNWLDSSLNSVKLVLTDSNGSTFSVVAVRDPSKPNPQTYKITDNASVGQGQFTADFFASSDASGVPVSTVDTPVEIQAPATAIPVSVGPPAHIQVVPNQALVKGETKPLLIVFTDSKGNFAAVNLNNIVLSSSAPGVVSTPVKGNSITGQSIGTADITATLGLLTHTATVSVTAGAAVTIAPKTATVTVGQTAQFTANTVNASGPVIWSVAEGAAGGTVTQSGAYTAPMTAGTYRVVATLPDKDAFGNPLLTEATVTVTAGSAGFNIH